MRSVSRFEANLLRVLHGLLHKAPRRLPALLKPVGRPKCLSRDAVELIQDALAKGCVQFLARRGWMRSRFLRDGKIAEGRLWQRTSSEALGLSFSADSLEFLLQLVTGTLGTAVPKIKDLTIGDRFLMFLAHGALEGKPAEEMRKTWLPLHQDGLCRLAFLEELPDTAQRVRIDWQTWTTGAGAAILECLQGWLAERWTLLECKKEAITSIPRMRALGTAQQRVYGEFLDALASAGRLDLARCFLTAAQSLLQDRPTARKWLRNLDLRNERIAERVKIYDDALALVRQVQRLQEWQNQALGVGYFDDGYAASQLWKADWERFGGDHLSECSRAIIREVMPIQ